jgi:hypothetical protein
MPNLLSPYGKWTWTTFLQLELLLVAVAALVAWASFYIF